MWVHYVLVPCVQRPARSNSLHTVTNSWKVKLLPLFKRKTLNPKEAKPLAGFRAEKVLEAGAVVSGPASPKGTE